MDSRVTIRTFLFFSLILFVIASCKSITSSDSDDGLEDSFDTVEEVELIPGADNVNLIVNKAEQSYFSLEFREIEENDLIGNGIKEGWCIDWESPINSQNGTYPGIQLFSTFGVEKWNELNTLLNMKDQILAQDSSISYREIQAAIWALRPRPAFDLDNIDTESLPRDMARNGELLFDLAKVKEIVQTAESNAKSFRYDDQTKFAIVAETPADVQTVITVVSKR